MRIMQKAVFLDRDGVLIENRSNYVRSISDIKFIPQALRALQILAQKLYIILLITNQSVVGRGIISLRDALNINQYILDYVKLNNGRIDGVYLCPHTPEDACHCRKPLPGMLLQAAQDLRINLNNSIFIGDALIDIQAGRSAGIQKLALVKTGLGLEQINLPSAVQYQPFQIYDDLWDALKHMDIF